MNDSDATALELDRIDSIPASASRLAHFNGSEESSILVHLAWNGRGALRATHDEVEPVDMSRLLGLTGDVIGAHPSECLLLDETASSSLSGFLDPFFRPVGHRLGILACDVRSPDVLAAMSDTLLARGLRPERRLAKLGARFGEAGLRSGDVVDFLSRYGHEYGVVWFAAVDPITGAAADIPAIVAAGREVGCFVGCDLSDAIGVMPLDAHCWQLDFALWRGDRYLGGRPGSPVGGFVHERHLGRDDLPPGKRASDSWPAGNGSHDLAMLNESLLVVAEVGLESLRARSIRLTGFIRRLLVAATPVGCDLLTPEDPAARGAQVSLSIGAAIAESIVRTLRDEHGIALSSPAPDVVVFAPSPLFTTYEDCWRGVSALERVLARR